MIAAAWRGTWYFLVPSLSHHHSLQARESIMDSNVARRRDVLVLEDLRRELHIVLSRVSQDMSESLSSSPLVRIVWHAEIAVADGAAKSDINYLEAIRRPTRSNAVRS
jgi:hypothetical protein